MRLASSVAPIAAFTLCVAAPSALPKVDCYIHHKDWIEYIGERRCVEFDGDKAFEGIWFNGFEDQTFINSAKTVSDVKPSLKHTWLSIDDKSVLPLGWRPVLGHAYSMHFVGRMNADGDANGHRGYGHLGGFEHLILVDRVIKAVDLGEVSSDLGWPKLTVLP